MATAKLGYVGRFVPRAKALRITPTQLGMRLLATGSDRMCSYPSMAEGIAHGRFLLIQCTREDHGYDLKAWHDLLARLKLYAPQSRFKPGKYSDMILAALENPEWIEAVRIAESENLLERIKTQHEQMRDATIRAERAWAGRERNCPKCKTAFVSVQDRGQCPSCRFIFLASNPDDNSKS